MYTHKIMGENLWNKTKKICVFTNITVQAWNILQDNWRFSKLFQSIKIVLEFEYDAKKRIIALK